MGIAASHGTTASCPNRVAADNTTAKGHSDPALRVVNAYRTKSCRLPPVCRTKSLGLFLLSS
jgi:hypothetical protein